MECGRPCPLAVPATTLRPWRAGGRGGTPRLGPLRLPPTLPAPAGRVCSGSGTAWAAAARDGPRGTGVRHRAGRVPGSPSGSPEGRRGEGEEDEGGEMGEKTPAESYEDQKAKVNGFF